MSDLCAAIEKFGKGLGNASRYRIVTALLKKPRTVGELVQYTHFSQPLVSAHLKTLKGCDLVTDKRRGQEIVYTINSSYMLGLLKRLSDAVKKQKQEVL